MIGLIGKKIGMTQVFDETGKLIPVTVIEFTPNVVVGRKTNDKDGYDAVLVGVHDKKKSRTTKAFAGQFPEGIAPKKIYREIRDLETDVAVGGSIGVSSFEGLRYVDCTAVSKGKGFQGVMKRWNFHGGRSTHGSKFHREPGSTGQRTYPHKTFKNVKLPGRMGREKVTVMNLRLVRVDAENAYLLVRGAVPGPRGCTVLVRSAVKKSK
jgi:large subunit ribosomal protein L3